MLVLEDTLSIALGAVTKTFTVPSIYPHQNVNRVDGTTLRQRKYSHVLGSRYRYEVVFTPDIVLAEEAFFADLLLANAVTVTVTLLGGTTRTALCTIDGGDVPVEYLESIIDLPQLRLTFHELDGALP